MNGKIMELLLEMVLPLITLLQVVIIIRLQMTIIVLIVGTIDLISPNALALTPTSISSSCGNSDGSANVTVMGGTVAIDYGYSWLDVSTATGLPNTTNSLTNITSGVYRVIVNDDNGCSDSTDIAVSDSDGPTLNIYIF